MRADMRIVKRPIRITDLRRCSMIRSRTVMLVLKNGRF